MSSHLSMSLVLLSLAACASQTSDRGSRSEARFEFEAGEVTISTLLTRCGAFLGWNILTNPQEIQHSARPATVTLERPVQTNREGCADMLSSLLWTRGFGLTPVDAERGIYEAVFLSGPRGRDYAARSVHRTVEEARARPSSYFCVTVAAPLQYINATIATNALRPFFASMASAGGGSLTLGNVGNANSLVLSGPQHTVVAALELLRAADVPTEGPTAPSMGARVDKLTQAVEQLTKRVQALEQKE